VPEPASSRAAGCLEALVSACPEALGELERAREAVGRHRGKGSGLARMLLRAVAALQEAAGEPCLSGCMLPQESLDPLRCGVGEALERLSRSLGGVASRLERLPRLSGGAEEELARMLLDAAYAAVDSLCSCAREAARLLEALGGPGEDGPPPDE